MDIRLEILALEQLLLQPEVRSNDRLLEELIADDFIEIGAVGKSWTKTEVIAGLISQDSPIRTIDDFKLRILADGVALATYLCRLQGANGIQTLSLRSSVWKRFEGGWQMVFHQGTRASDETPSIKPNKLKS